SRKQEPTCDNSRFHPSARSGAQKDFLMTMLDSMRRHRGWLKWSLALVVLSFIFLYIPNRQTADQPAASRDVVARVDGREITVDRFRRVYLQQMQAYRNAYGGNMDERLLKQLGIDQR